jgi:hypothetical protein
LDETWDAHNKLKECRAEEVEACDRREHYRRRKLSLLHERVIAQCDQKLEQRHEEAEHHSEHVVLT